MDDAGADALAMRIAGVSYDVIAQRCGFPGAVEARAAVEALVDTLAASPVAEAKLDLARLDRILVGVWRKASGGDVAAVRAALKVLEQRAVLLNGSSAPATPQQGVSSPLDELTKRRASRGAKPARKTSAKVAGD